MSGKDEEIRRDFVVEGHVQGVGFRWWTARHGRALGLRGTVRNREDGAVEVCASGPPAEVERLRRLIADGPAGAVVQRVRERPPGSELLPPGFEITR